MGLNVRRWVQASSGPTADAVIDHPSPVGEWIEAEHVPILLSPDPGGVAPHAGAHELLLSYEQTPVQHAPITNWNPGSPYPGPPSRVWKYVDWDSIRWWGKTGQGRLIWSEQTEFSADLPPNIPQDMAQHIDNWSRYMGGYPSMARNRPAVFGDQVPVLAPAYPSTLLPEG